MTDASQVRINELARELEVKAKAIIDVLPEVGLTEKKTHSSSVPVEIAEKVRQHFHSIAEAEASAEAAARSEERRVGKEWRRRLRSYDGKKKSSYDRRMKSRITLLLTEP